MTEQIAAREEIQAYYRQRASTDHYATSPDFNLREIEIDYLQRRLGDGLKVLDVGCGNGYSTFSHAQKFDSDFTGVDFVPEMVESAKDLAGQFELRGTVEFQEGDATDLQFADDTFDVVISQRCLLNLPSNELQWQAMRSVARVLKPGGRYLMLEGSLQGLRKLNEVRAKFDLRAIPEAAAGYNWFSNKFDEDEMLPVAREIFSEVEAINRFGMYYFISRVIHPLLAAPGQPTYDAPINKIAREICKEIPNYEDMGHVALFVLRK